MNRKELKELIKKVINSQENNKKNLSEWDSLAHLSILMELEKHFPNKITPINGIAEANNYSQIEKILISKKLVTND